MPAPLRILAETAYPVSAPGARVRLTTFAPFLAAEGVHLEFRPYLTDAEYRTLTTPAPIAAKAAAAGRSSVRALAARVASADVRLVYRLRTLIDFPGAERPRATDVYDFDDALFLGSISHGNRRLRWLKRENERWARYVRSASLVVAGNAFLADHARTLARRVEVVPSCIDPDHYLQREHADSEAPVVGWIGSRSTSEYLSIVLPALEQINRDRVRARLVLVGAETPFRAPWVERRPWSEATEARDLADFDIGIMPLPDDDWTRGKCGYKLLQYFAAGVPVVASPVGVNRRLVDDGRGVAAATEGEWVSALEELLADAGARRELGERGRVFAVAEYSYQRWARPLADLLRSVR